MAPGFLPARTMMRGMQYLTDQPRCEFPTLVPMTVRIRRGIHKGWTPRKLRNNDRRSSMDKTGQATRARQQELLIATWGPVCHICWANGITDHRAIIDLELSWPDPRCFTRDHVIPRSQGGLGTIENLRPAHHQCNRDRGDGPIVFEVVAMTA
jgi:5-methylcytosine-specific restriction endonuclease McrA